MKKQAQTVAQVGHVARILISSWGESEIGFSGRPRLFTWLMRILMALARLGLCIADAVHFLDVGSDVYRSLVRSVPSVIDRHAFENLAAMSPGQQSEHIESTRHRMLGFLSNPIIQAMLGQASDVLDLGKLRRHRNIVIVNLRQGGVLREEDQQILANLFLAELLHDTFNSESPTPYYCFLDELPVFARGSGPELTAAAGQIRKFKTRIVTASQGANAFPERYDDRLLHALMGQCGLNFFFRHTNPADAKFFGEVVGLPTYSPKRIKHEQKQEQQYQDGHDLVTLTDTNYSTTEQESVGGSENVGTSEGETWSTSESSTASTGRSASTSNSRTTGRSQAIDDPHERQLRRAVNNARASVTGSTDTTTRGQSSTRGGSRGRTTQEGRNWSRMRGTTQGRTFKQTLVPRLRWRTITTGTTFYTPEEHVLSHASMLTSLAVGEAVAVGFGQPKLIRFPLAEDPVRRTPKFVAAKLKEFLQLLDQTYPTSEQVLLRRDQFLQSLIEELDQIRPADDVGDSPFPQ